MIMETTSNYGPTDESPMIQEWKGRYDTAQKELQRARDVPCSQCELLRKMVEAKAATVDENKRQHSYTEGLLAQTRGELEKCKTSMLDMQAKFSAAKAENDIMRPHYEEYRQKLTKGRNSVVGSMGEKSVFDLLESLVGSHADLQITNTKAGAGDMQLTWSTADLSRPLKITIEVKTSEGEVRKMVRKDYIDQARLQVQTQKADAGILLYSHSVHAEQRLWVDRTARLVVVGNYTEEGQIINALLHALMIAREREMDERSADATKLTEEDLMCTADINKKLVDQNKSLRSLMSTTNKSLDRGLKAERERTLEIVTDLTSLSSLALQQYPWNTKSLLTLEGERLTPFAQKKRTITSELTSTSAASKKKKNMSPMDCFKARF
jgi:hypothetical protein